MLSVVVYGRNDTHGYNLHRRAAISLNCIAALLADDTDEILFVDYNTPDDLPTFPEAISDTLTPRAKQRLRIVRARPGIHRAFRDRTHLPVLEPIARNIAVRRSRPTNRWILSTNTDLIFSPRQPGRSLSAIAAALPDGFYQLPRFELPETLWESFDRLDPAATLEAVSTYGQRLHLNEVVATGTQFDAVGDFQLILRADLFAIDGFDERMISGRHVDANLYRRMELHRGGASSLLAELFAYHCDHTRQATELSRFDLYENDWQSLVSDLQQATLPDQRASWGLPDAALEEMTLTASTAATYVQALTAAIERPNQEPYYRSARTEATYDDLQYVPEHVLPYVCDLLASLPKAWDIGYFGCRPAMFDLFRKAWYALGFHGRILVSETFARPLGLRAQSLVDDDAAAAVRTLAEDDVVRQARLFLFEFGLASVDDPDVPQSRGRDWTEADITLLATTKLAFERVTDAERAATGESRRFIAVNATHNMFQATVSTRLNSTFTPFSARVSQGFVSRPSPEPREQTDLRTIAGHVGKTVNRSRAIDYVEINTLLRGVGDMLKGRSASASADTPRAALLALLKFPHLHRVFDTEPQQLDALAERLSAAPEMSALARASLFPVRPVDPAAAAQPPLSALASVTDWERTRWFDWASRYFGGTGAYRYGARTPRVWERTQLLFGLNELGLLGPDKRGLVLVNSPDEIYSILSELVGQVQVEILDPAARDDARQAPDRWRRPLGLFVPRNLTIAPDPTAAPDPAAPPPAFAVFPHSSVLRRDTFSLWIELERVTRRLPIGGVVALSIEIVIDAMTTHQWIGPDLLDSSVVRSVMPRTLGLTLLEPSRLSLDHETLERPAGDPHDGRQFIRPHDDGTRRVSAVLFLQKIQEPQASAVADLFWAMQAIKPDGLLADMTTTDLASRNGPAVLVARDQPHGHVLYGPYIRMPAGKACLSFDIRATQLGQKTDLMELEICAGDRVIARRAFSAKDLRRNPWLEFSVPDDVALGSEASVPLEFKFGHFANAALELRAVRLVPQPPSVWQHWIDTIRR